MLQHARLLAPRHRRSKWGGYGVVSDSKHVVQSVEQYQVLAALGHAPHKPKVGVARCWAVVAAKLQQLTVHPPVRWTC